MVGRACCASVARVGKVPVRGLDMTVCLMCGAVWPCATYRGGVVVVVVVVVVYRGGVCGPSLYWNM